MKKDITISVIVPARPNSKFLAHFILSFLEQTEDKINTDLHILASEKDEWNKHLFKYFRDNHQINFYYEDYGLGQRGHHIYLNELSEKSKGDWVLALCDDMDIVSYGWDTYIRGIITNKNLDPIKIYQIVPAFKNAGAVEHILSRGWLEVTGRWANYPNADSWLNTITGSLPDEIREERRFQATTPFFEDYSVYGRFMNLMNTEVPGVSKKGEVENPSWESPEVLNEIGAEVEKIVNAIRKGGR